MGNLSGKVTNPYGGGNCAGKKGARVHRAKGPTPYKKGSSRKQ